MPGPIEIVSGDRDLFALVCDPNVRVLYPTKGVSSLAEIDEAEIERRFHIPGRAYADYAILRGDPSDGLPGVPGLHSQRPTLRIPPVRFVLPRRPPIRCPLSPSNPQYRGDPLR